jgi:hypothetical protein
MDIASLGTSANADPLVTAIGKYDLAEHIVELDAYGFTVIPPEKTGVSADLLERLQQAVVRGFEERWGFSVDDYTTFMMQAGPESGAACVLEEDEAFIEMVLHPITLIMARWLCGQGATLSLTGMGAKGQTAELEPGAPLSSSVFPLHIDTNAVPMPLASYAQACNTSWILTDYATVEDGPTVLVPGSHKWGRMPGPHEAIHLGPDGPFSPAPVPLNARAGSLVVWHGGTWHGSLPRTNPGLRLVYTLYWARNYLKPAADWKGNFPEALLEKYPELRQILDLESFYPLPYRGDHPHPERAIPFLAASLDQFA